MTRLRKDYLDLPLDEGLSVPLGQSSPSSQERIPRGKGSVAPCLFKSVNAEVSLGRLALGRTDPVTVHSRRLFFLSIIGLCLSGMEEHGRDTQII